MNLFKDKKGDVTKATLFLWIDELFVGKRNWNNFSDADKKKFSPFMINRYLSMNDDFLPFVNYFQKYTIEVMPHKAVYQFYCNLLPKKKTYLKYMSGKKERTNDLVVPFIMKYFEVSKYQAADYYDLMTKEELILLVKKYGKSDKEIKKMKIR
jgi:hypothetical protein